MNLTIIIINNDDDEVGSNNNSNNNKTNINNNKSPRTKILTQVLNQNNPLTRVTKLHSTEKQTNRCSVSVENNYCTHLPDVNWIMSAQ